MKIPRQWYCALVLSVILGIHRGRLALLRAPEGTVLRLYPCRVDMLPPADRVLLEQGIPITGTEQLARVLEDYLS